MAEIASFPDPSFPDLTIKVFLDTGSGSTYSNTYNQYGQLATGSVEIQYTAQIGPMPGWNFTNSYQCNKVIDDIRWYVQLITNYPFITVLNSEPDTGTTPDCDLTITSVTITPESAAGAGDATATVNATSSNGPIRYTCDGPEDFPDYQTSNQFTGLTAGFYTFEVTDEAGCLATSNLTITIAPAPPDKPDIVQFEGLNIQIGQDMVDIPPGMDVAVNIKYQREDGEDPQKKRSSEALNVTLPATLFNQSVSNYGEDAGLLDLTHNHTFESHRPAVIRHKGFELLVGKAFLQKATYRNGPQSYEYSFYGNNADWIIDGQDLTLLDCCKHLFFPNSLSTVMNSWLFDGTNEALPYVFAPVRYANVFGEDDTDCKWQDLRPALSKWFVLYWGFKKLGYRVQSDFMQTEYFRRQVLPWTWGNYLKSEGLKQDNLDFLALNEQTHKITGVSPERTYVPLKLYLGNDSTLGAFDNNGVYAMNSAGFGEGRWTYLPTFNYGPVEATFYLRFQSSGQVTSGSNINVRFDYYKNGVKVAEAPILWKDSTAVFGNTDVRWYSDEVNEAWTTLTVQAGDVVSIRAMVRGNIQGSWNMTYTRIEWAFEYFRITDGGIIAFEDFNGLQQHKFLDYFRGLVDEFNLDVETDSVNKVVLLEPSHEYSLTANLGDRINTGYFNGKAIDWTDKEDIEAPGEVALFSDMEQNLAFSYKEDAGDGVAKLLLARNNVAPGTGRYVFPARFKKGKKDYTNRFFSPSIHYTHTAWEGLSTNTPQIMALIPENVSDTSAKDAVYQFAPRSAYYKGLVSGIGWRFEGQVQGSFPFMFAVNYMPGGENDPVLSYSDELIGDKIGYGLLKRYFWQRLANLRAGKFLKSHFRLTEKDVQNWFHREHIIRNNLRYELRALDFKPVTGESTECELRLYSPVSLTEHSNTFPSENSLRGLPPVSSYDTRYYPLTALQSDIPQ